MQLAENFLGLTNSVYEDQLVFNEKKKFFCFRQRYQTKAHCLGKSKGRSHVYVSKKTQKNIFNELYFENLKFFVQVKRKFYTWF